jgi:hypothetical protein
MNARNPRRGFVILRHAARPQPDEEELNHEDSDNFPDAPPG